MRRYFLMLPIDTDGIPARTLYDGRMLAEWTVECAAEDPILVVPWKDADGTAAFVDLRANPYEFDSVVEAEQHPPLMQALRALNATRSPVFTAKCDAWPLDADELEMLQLNLDIPPADAPAGFSSYIDLVWRDRSLFGSFHRQEQMLRRLTRLAAPVEAPVAALECVLRPAFVDLEGPREGFAVSLYVKALGASPQTAWQEWATALATIVALFRSNDFAR
jgi:hypothetical protein